VNDLYHGWRTGRFATLLLILWSVTPGIASAAQIAVPLNLDYMTLSEASKRQMYTAPGGRAELWSGSDPCQFFYATNPRFGYNFGTLTLETDAELRLGIGVAGGCVSPLNWSGIIAADLQPYFGPDLVIKFRVTNLNLYKPNHEKSLLVGLGFDVVKSNLIPRLETFFFDLKPPLQQLNILVQAAAPPDVAARVKAALATLRPASTVIPEDE
jgi:hypothetical protein